MPELSPAPSINDDRTQALLVLIERLAALDLTALLIYRFDSVPAGALPFLAWQFDVLSPLWQLIAPVTLGIDALTDIDALIDIDNLIESDASGVIGELTVLAQRELLKNAIPLHRFRGTPGAIKRALAALGWPQVALLEGQSSWGGGAYPDSEGWAVFRAMIELAAGQGVAAGAVAPVLAAIDFFKPARAWLDSVWFVVPGFADRAPRPADLLTLGGIATYQLDRAPAPAERSFTISIHAAPLSDPRGPIAPIYNRRYRHSGITYGAGEPVVADSALVMGGVAILHGG